MFNYEHEISRIRDKYIHNFLWISYFHDAKIKEIRIENNGNDIFIVLECDREDLEYEGWKKYIYLDASSDKNNHDYEMHFSDCKNFTSNIFENCNRTTYLYCVFKNSALLKRISKSFKKKYYHARMELSTGFIDVIFNKFTVSKKQGTLVIRKNFGYSNYFDSIRERYSTLDIKKVLFLAKEGEDPEKLEALEYLWLTGHKKCKKLAVKALNDEYAWVAAVFILGEIGDIGDISSLRKKALRLEKYEMPGLLHINDALEKIFYRS